MRLLVFAGAIAGLFASAAVVAQQTSPMNPGGSLAPPPKFLAMYELAVTESKDLAWFCAPREAPATLLRQQFVEWAKDNGDQLEQEAIVAVRQAMTDAFPCQE
jgi:hypothetical protein